MEKIPPTQNFGELFTCREYKELLTEKQYFPSYGRIMMTGTGA